MKRAELEIGKRVLVVAPSRRLWDGKEGVIANTAATPAYNWGKRSGWSIMVYVQFDTGETRCFPASTIREVAR